MVIEVKTEEEIIAEKKKNKKEKSVMNIFATIFFILAIIAFVFNLSLNLYPFTYVFFAFIISVIWFFVMLIGTIISIGLVWATDGWRAFSHNFYNFLGKVWDSSSVKIIADLYKNISLPCFFVTLLGFIFVLINFLTKKNKKGKIKAQFIAMDIIFVLEIITLILGIIFYGNNKF